MEPILKLYNQPKDHVFEWSNDGSKCILNIYSPVRDEDLKDYYFKWIPYHYWLVMVKDLDDHKGSDITNGRYLLITKVLSQYKIPKDRCIWINCYNEHREGLFDFYQSSSLVDIPTEFTSNQDLMFYDIQEKEVELLKEGQKIQHKTDMSPGYTQIYNKYKRYI